MSYSPELDSLVVFLINLYLIKQISITSIEHRKENKRRQLDKYKQKKKCRY